MLILSVLGGLFPSGLSQTIPYRERYSPLNGGNTIFVFEFQHHHVTFFEPSLETDSSDVKGRRLIHNASLYTGFSLTIPSSQPLPDATDNSTITDLQACPCRTLPASVKLLRLEVFPVGEVHRHS